MQYQQTTKATSSDARTLNTVTTLTMNDKTDLMHVTSNELRTSIDYLLRSLMVMLQFRTNILSSIWALH